MKRKNKPVINRALPGNESLLKQLWDDPMGRAGMIGVGIVILLAAFAPWIAHFDVGKMNSKARFAAPNATYWFGTDNFGRDIYSRIVYGARVSIIVGVVAVSIAAGFGYLFGLIAGFFEGKAESVIMMVMDVVFAFPHILLALFIVIQRIVVTASEKKKAGKKQQGEPG